MALTKITGEGTGSLDSLTTTGALDVTTSTHANASVFKSTGNTQLFLQDTDASANDQFWGLQVSGGDFNVLTCNDDRASGFVTPLTIAQAGDATFSESVIVTGTASRGLKITSATTSSGQNDADAVYDAQDTEGGGTGSHLFKVGGTEHVALDSTGAIRVYSDTGGTGAAIFNTAQGSGTSANLMQARHSASSTAATSGTQMFFMTTNGNLFNQNNSYGQISDQKVKQDIADAASQWDDIKAVKVKKFRYKVDVADQGSENVPLQIGVIAQELETANMNGLVCEHPDVDDEGNDLGTTTKSVKYSVLYMKAIKALQEAMTRIETLEAKVAALEGS